MRSAGMLFGVSGLLLLLLYEKCSKSLSELSGLHKLVGGLQQLASQLLPTGDLAPKGPQLRKALPSYGASSTAQKPRTCICVRDWHLGG